MTNSHLTCIAPPEVRACCACLKTCLVTGIECHAMVHACRDVASRVACTACLERHKNWKTLCRKCFRICDACDSYCHQRCSLAEMRKMCSSGMCDLRCAFESGPQIPGTAPYKAPQDVRRKCCVYCANSACGAEQSYCDAMRQDVEHVAYPGGLLEYHCRTQLDRTLPSLVDFDPTAFLHRECSQGCVP